MVSTLKENPSGGFYCSECRMSTAEPVEVCPFCGSICSNYESIVPEIIVGGRWNEPEPDIERFIPTPEMHQWYKEHEEEIDELWRQAYAESWSQLIDSLVDIKDIKVGDKVK